LAFWHTKYTRAKRARQISRPGDCCTGLFQSSLRVAGTEIEEYCVKRAPDTMFHFKSQKCRTEGCGKGPSFGVAGTKTAGYCAQHALDGMVNVRRRKCRIEGCDKFSSFGVPGTKTTEYC
ncbi:unnamed protein product, partial [Ascophyllum nodosum]